MKELFNSSKQVIKKVNTAYFEIGCRAHMALLAVTGMLLTSFPELAEATPTIGDLGNNAGDQTTGLTSGALRLFGFIGIVMVGIAFMKGRTAKQNGESIGGYITMGIIGGIMLSIVTIISIVNVSLIGSDASSTIQGQIIQ